MCASVCACVCAHAHACTHVYLYKDGGLSCTHTLVHGPRCRQLGSTQLPLQVMWLRTTLYKCAVIMCTDRLELLLPEDETTEAHCDGCRECQPHSPREGDQSALKRKETLIQSVTWMNLEDRQEGKRPDSNDPAHLLSTLGASRQDRGDCHAGTEADMGEWISGILKLGGTKWSAMHLNASELTNAPKALHYNFSFRKL